MTTILYAHPYSGSFNHALLAEIEEKFKKQGKRRLFPPLGPRSGRHAQSGMVQLREDGARSAGKPRRILQDDIRKNLIILSKPCEPMCFTAIFMSKVQIYVEK